MLQAVFHLLEELQFRIEIEALPNSDIKHLNGDAHRVYKLIAIQWLNYMQYLADNYPYLFSLAMRTNPFDENRTVIVKD